MKKFLIAAACILFACGLTACSKCGTGHTFTVENKCSVCGEEWEYTEDLSYAESGNGTCSVSGIGPEQEESRVVIPYGHDGMAVTAVGEEAFYGRVDMTTVILPQSVLKIGTNSFSNCVHLTEIEIPVSVKEIGAYAFYRCAALTVQYAGTVAQWNAIEKEENWNASAEGLFILCRDGGMGEDGTVTES